MDFSLSEDQKMLKAMLRDFATKELEPVAAQIDEAAEYPAEQVSKVLVAFGVAGASLLHALLVRGLYNLPVDRYAFHV